MAKNDNLQDFLIDIADSIREKMGNEDLINPQDFSSKIKDLDSLEYLDVSKNQILYIDLILHSVYLKYKDIEANSININLTNKQENLLDIIQNVTQVAIDFKSPIKKVIDGISTSTNVKNIILKKLTAEQLDTVPRITKQDFYNLSEYEEWIDLGLPSGTLWASRNLGSNSIDNYGYYYAWGETQGRIATNFFYDDQYKYGEHYFETKYNNEDGICDLVLNDDAAYAVNNKSRMPSKYECNELFDNTTCKSETINNINGYRLTSNINGNSIFIPSTGHRQSGRTYNSEYINLWTNARADNYCCSGAQYMLASNKDKRINDTSRYAGMPIRAVLPIPKKSEDKFVDLGLPSKTLWATCNVGANSPEEYGNYYTWGDSENYDNNSSQQFTQENYKWYDNSGGMITKYCIDDKGIIDNLATIQLEDDAAYQSDNSCRIPSLLQIRELLSNTVPTETVLNGVSGRLFTSKINGNSIFIPAAGYYNNGILTNQGNRCEILSNQLACNTSTQNEYAYYSLDGYRSYYSTWYRWQGRSIRPVKIRPNVNLYDIAYWDGSSVKTTSKESWDSSLGTPIGVVVIASGVVPDGHARIVSLESITNNVWGYKTGDTGLSYYYTNIPIIDDTGTITEYKQNGYIPSDKQTGQTSYTDPYAKYVDYPLYSRLIPSPYLSNGTANPDYYRNAKISPNSYKTVVGDLDGLNNTQDLLKRDYSDAALKAWEYSDGASDIQWYLPAAGELGFLITRVVAINEILNMIGATPIKVAEKFWSSTEYSGEQAYRVDNTDGQIYSYDKEKSAKIRPFALI